MNSFGGESWSKTTKMNRTEITQVFTVCELSLNFFHDIIIWSMWQYFPYTFTVGKIQ